MPPHTAPADSPLEDPSGPPFVLLENLRAPPGEPSSLLFEDPAEIVRIRPGDDPMEALQRIDAAAAAGLHPAGWLAYELGYLLEPRLAPLLPTSSGLLAWFGLFRRRRRLTRAAADALWSGDAAGAPHALRDVRAGTARGRYLEALEEITRHLHRGDSYQVNYTLKYHFRLEGRPEALYAHLRRRQPTEFGGFLWTGERSILSLSPELFYRRRGSRIECRPMKGTARRGADPVEDEARAEWLRTDPKNRAENVMIVDLLRNDLGRIARPGSLRVPRLFDVERYETVLQMTSTVEAEVAPDLSFPALVRSLFPCGSVTGAPKIRTMQIIRALEPEPRGVYTGSIGYLGADGDSCFNVAIRTVVIEPDGRGEMGVGSGIVVDSDPATEWEECGLKAEFLLK